MTGFPRPVDLKESGTVGALGYSNKWMRGFLGNYSYLCHHIVITTLYAL